LLDNLIGRGATQSSVAQIPVEVILSLKSEKGWRNAGRAPVLDAWLRARGFSVPPDATRAELAKQAANASEDSTPVIAWSGTEVRIWDGRLHATPPLASPAAAWQSQWDGIPLALPTDCGELRLESIKPASTHTTHAPLDPPLTVRFRKGGERIKPTGDPHTRELRDLFQQARLPPWLRVRCPLIYENDALIAVADLWTSERGKTVFDARDAQPLWIRPAWSRCRLG